MMVHIPKVLTPEQVARCRDVMMKAEWVDGRITAGHQSAKVKLNLQLPETAPEATELGDMVLAALARNSLFVSAVLPKQVFPPLFNRYREGMTFGSHVDGAIRTHEGKRLRIRSDLSATLFLSEPDEYEGGELLIEDVYGVQRVKLASGSLVLYPATSLHRVEPIRRGVRLASFFWIQSMVRQDAQRTLLFDLDMAIIRLRARDPGDASLISLVGVYHNLLRMWADP